MPETNSSTIKNATGKSLDEWFNLIKKYKLTDCSHKDIAEFLSLQPGVSYWWAQEITVHYEKEIGRRKNNTNLSSGKNER